MRYLDVSEGEMHWSEPSVEPPKPAAHVYGVRFDGFPEVTKGVRTDDAAGFGDVHPAVSNGTGDSPFDDLMPWSGMVPEDREGGRMVAIPRFWYRLEQNGKGINVYISTAEADGYHVSPAHMDRNDGKGEREVVYVGRYHCATGTYKSTSKAMPANKANKASMISSIKSIGDAYYMMDFATCFTIWLLYLVECADWNSQKLIGFGCGNDSSPENMGYTDSMQYCTGTTQSSTTTQAIGTQYRNIEGLWDNVYDFLSGCYNDGNGLNLITDAAKLGDLSGGKSVGTPANGWVGELKVSETGGFPIFYNANTSGGSDSAGTCDYWYSGASYPVVCAGGSCSWSAYRGLFSLYCATAADSSATLGSRLLELP